MAVLSDTHSQESINSAAATLSAIDGAIAVAIAVAFGGDGRADIFRYHDGVSGAEMYLSAPDAGDRFVFLAGGGRDVVSDFQAAGSNHDVIEIDHTLFADFNAVMAHSQQVGPDTVITYDTATAITLSNVTKTTSPAPTSFSSNKETRGWFASLIRATPSRPQLIQRPPATSIVDPVM